MGNQFYLYITMDETTLDYANNRSLVNSKLYIVTGAYSVSWGSQGSHIISGNTVWSINGDTMTFAANTTYLLSESNIWHPRGATGTTNARVQGSFQNINGTNYYNVPYLGVDSGLVALTDFDRKPNAPSTVSLDITANKELTVSSNTVTSPAGTATYYYQYSSSTDGGSTWSAWSTEVSTTVTSYTFSVPFGRTYKARVRAGNIDGISAYSVSNSPSSLFLPAGGKRWDGSGWQNVDNAKRWSGTGWDQIQTAKRWNGSGWVDLT